MIDAEAQASIEPEPDPKHDTAAYRAAARSGIGGSPLRSFHENLTLCSSPRQEKSDFTLG
jgi:hypothetical protein